MLLPSFGCDPRIFLCYFRGFLLRVLKPVQKALFFWLPLQDGVTIYCPSSHIAHCGDPVAKFSVRGCLHVFPPC
jgi:hypothetical protein